MRSFVDLRWFVGLSFVAWACAKGNTPEGGDSYNPVETGGTSSSPSGATGGAVGTGGFGTTGGASSLGGSTATGGSAGTGGSGAAGGSAPMGGSTATGGVGGTVGGSKGGSTAAGGTGGSLATGGSTSTGGSTAAGGSGGTGMPSGGMTGQAGMGTSLTGDGSYIVFYEAADAHAMTSTVSMSLYIMNQTADALDLSTVEVRYWMTAEPAAPATHSYYSATGVKLNTPPTFVAGPPSYLSFTFAKGGSVAAKNKVLNDTEFQGTVDTTMGMFDQTNDWSFNAKDTMPQANPNVTLYVAGKLVWGCEPTGVCPGGMVTPQMTGQGGAPAMGGQGGMPAAGVGGDLGASGAAD